eukprot:TRINITY_DN4071_c0_g1_i1.p1 TRINITY_DN4071_c0_g1~~TRINITY_DN4071_c0_g1_i1.p1  ORF type:complete len:211 (-),score=57.95 TRINITY_DN4071_c0_g1_i1:171-803(-)
MATHTKRIHLIRHGESTHNLACEGIPKEKQVDPYEWDADLSPTGEKQVKELAGAVGDLKPDLIISSPLTRALKTTYGAFGDVPVLVQPIAREGVENACDIGTPKPLLTPNWEKRGATFGEVAQDLWWYAPVENHTIDNYQQLFREQRWEEPHEEVVARTLELEKWILQRPEKEIVVVGHSSFIKAWTGMDRKLANVEIHTITREAPTKAQ